MKQDKKYEYLLDYTSVKEKGLVKYLYNTDLKEIGLLGYAKRGLIVPAYLPKFVLNSKANNFEKYSTFFTVILGEFSVKPFFYISSFYGYKMLYDLVVNI